VLNMVLGAFLALAFFGLPLAIIGLFIAGTIDRRGSKPPEGYVSSLGTTPSASAISQGRDRRRIVYGGYWVAASAKTPGASARPRPWAQGLTLAMRRARSQPISQS
jgi:hypothetical protein